ncbi:type I polyketide synthase [Amycolatopsis nigrescens]|uniref:type I polyketide synthase n=1 Tax=Amycolatopsis nigrescens TaxID=381445 RepID=UPI0003695AED|nr:type I polyketide synthase [Amycolatopsis nigrescens]
MKPTELRQWLVTRIAETCDLDPAAVDPARPLREYGLTSREAVLLAGELEDLLDRDLPTALIWQHPTIDALAGALLGEPAPESVPESEPVAAAEPIAVVGIGCRLPGGVDGPERFWRLLMDGDSAISDVPEERWAQFGHDSPEQAQRLSRLSRRGGFLDGISAFDAEFFGIAPREAAAMDPQQRLLLEVAWEALEQAGIAPESLRGSSAGVFVGISGNEYSHLTLNDLSRIDAWSGTGAALSIAANRLSYVLDLRGPSVAVDSACSSSLTAVHLAIQSLRSGESEVALAAGVNLLLAPGIVVNFDEMGVLSADGRCKAFDAAADGIARAEGAGVVVLKPLSKAVRDGDRVLAVLRGSAVNSDGRSNGLTAPNPEAQQALLRAAYRSSGVDPAEVDYVEAHGTGTLLGDPIEAGALGAVLGRDRPAERPLLLGSVKTNLGHLEAAAGITGLIKVVLALANRRIPASLNFTEPNPHIPFERLRLAVAAEQQQWPGTGRPARAGVSGFGFGGTNAHVVVEQAPAPPAVDPAPAGPGQFLLADATADRLRRRAGALADWLGDAGEFVELSDVEHSMARRAGGRHRAVVTARDRAELTSGLRSLAAGTATTGVATGVRDQAGPGVVWVFSGQGSHWAGMGRRLLTDEPAFATAVDEIDRALAAESGPSLRATLESGTVPTAFAELQPVLFGTQLALARLWQSYGAAPSAIVGHSLGEVAAAVVAGAVSLADGAAIAVRRSRLLAGTAGSGAMAALELGAEETQALLAGYPGVDIAVFNAPRQTVVSGAADQVRELAAVVERRGLMARLVKSEVAGHSRLVDEAAKDLRAELSGLAATGPSIPFYRAASDEARADGPLDAGYWVGNVRRPVRFTQAISAAIEDGFRTFVEISPHPVLFHAVTETAAAQSAGVQVLPTLRRDEDEARRFHAGRGALLALGGHRPATTGRLLDLPTTRWERRDHWARPVSRRAAVGAHPLLGTHIELPEERTHLWQADLGTLSQPWLAEHTADRVDDRPVLPAGCFAELALVAASTALGVPPARVELTGLSLPKLLPLTEHTPVTTTFSADETGGRIRVHTKTAEGSWVLHAQAKAVLHAEPAVPEPLDRRGRTEVPAPDEGAKPGYLLHPVLLQDCLRTLTGALAHGGDEVPLVTGFGSVRLSGDPAAATAGQVRIADGSLGELRLADGDGKALLTVTGIRLHAVPHAEVAAPLRDRLLDRVWRPAEPPAARDAGPSLILAAPGNPLASRLRTTLEVLGGPVRVLPDTEPDAIRDALDTERPASVVLLLEDGDPDGLESGRRGVLKAAELTRLLSGLGGTPPRLWLVTGSAAAVLPEEPGRPGPASVRGLVRVLTFEHPALRASWLDLDASDVDRAAAEAAVELAAGAADDEVAWRGGRRYVARLGATATSAGAPVPAVRADGGYVVTGGLGGLGLLLATWLAERGAGRIVLNGRSAPKPAVQAMIEELRSAGTAIEVVLGDVAESGVAEALFAAAGNGAVPRGLLHGAAVFEDQPVAEVDAGSLRRSWLPKADGAWRLHEASAGLDLDWWLGFSSAAALHGGPGQPAYATANAYLDALAALRRARGLPATTINWGTWAEVGAAADKEIPWMYAIRPGEGVELVEHVLSTGIGSLGALRMNVPKLIEGFPNVLDVPFFTELLGKHAEAARQRSGWPGIEAVRDREPAEIRALAGTQLRARIASVTGLEAEALPDDVALTSLGVDSLLAVRIGNALQHDFAATPPMSLLLRGADLAALRDWLFAELGVADRPELPRQRRTRGDLVPPRDAAERLVVAAWQEVLGAPVGVTSEFDGDEAAAERVAGLLRERGGHEFATAELFARRTPELMAELIRNADTARSGPVRVLRESGDQRPLFFFHPGGGDTAVFRQLVGHLAPGVPAYGLDHVPGPVTVEDRVEAWLPEIRRIQPSGPYRLAGWSFGGFLAFEAAQRLTAAGERVELLAMVDSILPLPHPPGLSEVEVLERRFARFAEFLETSYGKGVNLPYEEMARLDDVAQAEFLAERIRAAGVVDERVGEAILTHQQRSFLDVRMLERYQPDGYDGPVVYYSPADQVPGGMRDERFDRTDPARGWDSICRDLEVVTVPGHHLSVLDPPNVEVIAAHLQRALDGLRARYSRV